MKEEGGNIRARSIFEKERSYVTTLLGAIKSVTAGQLS